MAKVALLSLTGEKVTELTLKKDVWGIEPNDAVLHNAIVLALAGLRQGTSKVKHRGEVRGGGRKPWRQKGTGRARQGSIRSPQWRGGGVVFGPTPRDYSKKMNRKERRLALKSALSYTVKDKALIAVENFITEPKTKEFIKVLENLKVTGKVLVVVDELDENTYKASRNLGGVRMVTADSVGVLDVVNSDFMIASEAAIKILEEVLTNA